MWNFYPAKFSCIGYTPGIHNMCIYKKYYKNQAHFSVVAKGFEERAYRMYMHVHVCNHSVVYMHQINLAVGYY